eukprot:TRINITY_DN65165_c0_g1_i1.p3 TRINITY_DN65165_c0_g1~~TRINITY_DN65165_c0_g1_i1.p3  ORF type:complete len:103 (+),score=32.14 TRINITY_DN65165_c0_g1_i1:144-452(+)
MCIRDRYQRRVHGGNKNANNYFEKNGLIVAGCFDYSSPMAAKYRSELGKKAEAAVASYEPRVDQEVIETTEEEIPRKMSGPKKVVMETQPPETVAHRKKIAS